MLFLLGVLPNVYSQSFCDSLYNTPTITDTISIPPTEGETLCDENPFFIPDRIIGQGGVPTSSSSLPATISGEKILLQGDLIIDSWLFNLIDCSVLVSPNKKIVVQDGNWLEIYKSRFFACDEMWQGIQLFNSSTLTMEDAHIEDALVAVQEFGSSSFIWLNGAFFNRNLIGIKAVEKFQQSQGLEWHGFADVKFDCTSNLNPPYETRNQSLTGIEIKGRSGTIGQGSTNEFINQENGISASLCYIDVEFCKFDNCEIGIDTDQTILKQKGFGKFITSFNECGTGIFSTRSSLNTTLNHFVNTGDTDIKSEGNFSILDVVNNSFFNATDGTRSRLGSHIYNDISSYFPININSNHFESIDLTYLIWSSKGGIKSQNLNIINNTINIGSADENSLPGRVWEVGELRGPNVFGTLNLKDNIVDIHLGSKAQTGAWHLHDFKMVDVQDNFVTNFSNQNDTQRGIFCSNSQGSFCVNHVENLSTGIEFEGKCLSEQMFSKSDFGKNETGLLLSSTNAATQIGWQTDKENTWLNISQYSNKAASCTHNCGQSRFIVNGGNPSYYPNGSIEPINGWFFPSGTGSNACIPGLAESDIPIANGSYFTGNTSAVIEWDAKRYLFERLLKNPNLITTDASLEAFYDAESGTNIESFSIIKSMIEDAVKIPSETTQILSENNQFISQKLDEIRLLDAQISAPVNNENIQLIKKSKVDSIDLLSNQIDSITNQISLERNLSFQQILIENDQLNPQTDYEWNEKDLNDIILNHWLSGEENLSEEDINRVRFITGQCPESGGTIVLRASNYLPECERMEYKANPLNCHPQAHPKSNSHTKASRSSTQNGIELFPNPANSKVTIKFNKVTYSSKTILVTNILGTTLKQIPVLNEREISINLSDLSSGFYQIIGIDNRGKINWKEKLVLNN